MGGSVNVWQSRQWRRSRSGKFLIEVSQDFSNDGGLGDEGEDLHGSAAPGTGQRVDLVDAEDKLGPPLTQSAPGNHGARCLTGCS